MSSMPEGSVPTEWPVTELRRSPRTERDMRVWGRLSYLKEQK